MYDFFKNNESIFILSISFSIIYFLIFFGINQFKFLFVMVNPNQKTALFHKPLIRGVGIFYLIPLIVFWLIFPKILEYYEFILILITTILGFLDDRFNLSQKVKFISLIVIFIIFLYL